jgi:hypothetical protein
MHIIFIDKKATWLVNAEMAYNGKTRKKGEKQCFLIKVTPSMISINRNLRLQSFTKMQHHQDAESEPRAFPKL